MHIEAIFFIVKHCKSVIVYVTFKNDTVLYIAVWVYHIDEVSDVALHYITL